MTLPCLKQRFDSVTVAKHCFVLSVKENACLPSNRKMYSSSLQDGVRRDGNTRKRGKLSVEGNLKLQEIVKKLKIMVLRLTTSNYSKLS